MAIEDAVVLAGRLAQTPANPSEAFRAYEQARFARTASVQLAARETGAVNHARGAERVRRNAFLATRAADDYEAVAWLFGGDGPRPQVATGSEIGVFGRHAPPASA
jgi:salicylate hydroxylase